MSKSNKQHLLQIADSLITEGRAVLATEYLSSQYMVAVRPQEYAKWRAGCLTLIGMLGKSSGPWQEAFAKENNEQVRAAFMLGTLEGIRSAIHNDLLISVEDLVFAEAFSDLLEQADYLFSEGYFLAAGVLGRAVLEEHLRKLCERCSCLPGKPKTTLNDYNVELQKSGKFNKIEFKHVDSLAAIGNEAAHNKPGLKQEDVERLLRDLREFLVRHALS